MSRALHFKVQLVYRFIGGYRPTLQRGLHCAVGPCPGNPGYQTASHGQAAAKGLQSGLKPKKAKAKAKPKTRTSEADQAS